MILVLDASAAIELVLAEEHSAVVRALWDEPVEFLAPTVVVPEVAAAIAAAQRDGRLGSDAAEEAQQAWRTLVGEIHLRSVDADLAEAARVQATTRPARGMDAIYLAAALEVAAHSPVGLVTFDARQRAAARDDLALLPAALDG